MAGNYRLVARLGAGGMGEVYKGVHATIGSKVAIKLLHATAARDRSLQERFLLEAKAVNRIEHPGVVKVLDAGRTDNGRPFLVMELLDGSSLHELCKAGNLSMPQACRAMVDVLDALAAAHAAGVIHRDLKPANLFRTRDGRTVVLDFGVAKLMATDAPVRLTMTGSAVGTPHYMAPEQIRGQPVTPAVDIYAAGVVLFELLCGRRPFDNTDDESVMLGHLEKRPPPPRALEPAIPIAVQDVILAALAKDPAKRPPTAAAMRDALRAALDTAASPAGPAPSPWARPSGPPPTTDASTAVTIRASPVRASPVRASPVRASPVRASPVRASPVRASPVRASPVRASPGAKDPPTEPGVTPAAVVAHRQRSSRLRTFALVGAAAFAVAGVILVIYAARRSRAEVEASATTTPTSPSVDATVAIAIDAAPVIAIDAPGATCAQLVTVDPVGVADARQAEVKATYFRRCEEDRWSADAIRCFMTATSVADFGHCLAVLDDDQRKRFQAALVAPVERKPRVAKKSSPDHDDDLPTKDPFRAPRPDARPRDTSDDLRAPFSEAHSQPTIVQIESMPSGATVVIDGKPMGKTPLLTKLAPGSITVELSAQDYQSTTHELDVHADRANVLKVVLKRAVSSSPDASID